MSLNGETEPADPRLINHTKRREKRIAEPTFDCDRLPNPLVEHTDNGRLPMRLKDARDVYLKVSKHNINSDDNTSRLEKLRNRYGRVMGAERKLIGKLDNPSMIFLSLRQSPIQTVNGYREWIEPVRLRSQLNKPWRNIIEMLRRKLREFPRYEYVRTTGYTETAATPHYHVMIYIEDPDDELHPDVAESLVDCYVRGNEYASAENHPVEMHERDAAIPIHDIAYVDDNVSDSIYLSVLQDDDDIQIHSENSSFLAYMMNQMPDWCLSKIWDGSSDVDNDSIMADAGAISWASPFNDYTSSRGFPD